MDLLEALEEGKVCLHPTDSLLGLTADPRNPTAMARLNELKGDRTGKAYLGLVSDLQMALQMWEPLPKVWENFLSRFWPCPLTVIWMASSNAPKSLIHADGTLALRRPSLGHDKSWLYQVIKEVGVPLPSTSANRGGESPASNIEDIKEKFEISVFVSPQISDEISHADRPSTLIKIIDDQNFELLRAGAISEDILNAHLKMSHEVLGDGKSWLRQISNVDSYQSLFNGLDMNKFKLILGSSSPRRKDLLRFAGFKYEVIKPTFEEKREEGESATAYVRRNALEKAKSIAQQMNEGDINQSLIISADTVVAFDDRCLEKPRSPAEAHDMLQLLSGRKHSVFTGMCLLHGSGEASIVDVSVTESEVKFKQLTSEQIADYIATREPMDKAGSYGMQGIGSYLIEDISGSLSNVIGLPMETLASAYAQMQ